MLIKHHMPYSRPTVEWARAHAKYGDGRWLCNATGTILKTHWVWRTIGAESDFPFNGLEVKRVGHVFCPKCTQRYAIPYGAQIALKDLIGYRP